MKILVVEDDRDTAEVVEQLLVAYNYAADIAGDGEAGLAMAEAYPYDLIILDIGLPKLDGVEVCKQLRVRHYYNPILLLTGRNGSANTAIALNAGADDYVVKPFDSIELIARVQALLRRPANGSQAILTWGNLTFDPNRQQVSYGDLPLVFTPKEYAILELLLRNWRSPLGSRAILERVWTAHEFPAEEVVRTHIKELRQKFIAVGMPKDTIKTVYGMGYQLNPTYADAEITDRSSPHAELAVVRAQLAATQAELDRKNRSLIAQEIRQTLDLQEVLSRTVQRVRSFLATDRVVIFHFHPDWQGDVIAESVREGWLPTMGSKIVDSCFRDRYLEPYHQGRMSAIEDVDSAEISPCYRDLLASLQVKANLVVPILQGDRLWGLLIAHHCAMPRQWQPDEIDLLQRLATQVGIASQQSQLIENLQTELVDRQLAKQKIQEQAALLDIAADAIFVRDLDHRILYWNQGAERLYGWTAVEAFGKEACALLGENLDRIGEITQAVLDLGEWRGEVIKVTKTGAEVIVEGRWNLVRDETGQPKSILCVNTDITEKKQLQAQFYHAQRLESLGTLASGIAHDLNNVLTPILAFAQILRAQPGMDEKTQARLQIIENSARRGADMVAQILTFARGSVGNRIVLQIRYLLSDAIKVARQTFPKSIVIEHHLPDNLWLVAGDATQLHQVFLNLCVNARDAMPQGGTLRITAENQAIDQLFACMNINVRAGNYILVTIADTGTGIDPDLLDRIFDPFFTTKPIGKGTGLGLATVLGLVTTHGGFVRAASTVGQGTKFKIYLPAATEGETITDRSGSELLDGKGELILIVDDDPAVREVNRALLEEHNYQTLTASDGIDAMALYAQQMQAIDLVLIDAMMPNASGVTAIRAMYQMNHQVKIVAMSGLSSQQKSMLEAGARVFISKPYQLAELLRTISDLLNG